jgi:hypothetical protein
MLRLGPLITSRRAIERSSSKADKVAEPARLSKGETTMPRKRNAKTKAKRAAKDLAARKAAKGGNVSTYTVSTHLRRIYAKLG